MSSSEAHASRDHFFSLFIEVKQQRAMLVLGLVTASVHYSCL